MHEAGSRRYFSVMVLVPLACVASAMNCACISVGKARIFFG